MSTQQLAVIFIASSGIAVHPEYLCSVTWPSFGSQKAITNHGKCARYTHSVLWGVTLVCF